VSDRIFLSAMEFAGRHGVSDDERADEQLIEVDIELDVDLSAAGRSDDLADTVNYSTVFEICRARVEDHTYRLLEAIGEAICADILAADPRVERVAVTVRKPGVPIDGVLEHAGVRLERSRS
jgi:7,8-dihydroneopterin aldolase/epimerase/oxygenase